MSTRNKRIAISGSFDPLHTGHLNLIKEAKKHGDHLTVILKGNNRLKRKKGHFLLDEKERFNILSSIKEVDEVMVFDTSSDTDYQDISDALYILKPDIYCAGAETNDHVIKACQRMGIEVITGVGGDKIQNSSTILKNYVLPYEKYKEIVEAMPILCVDCILVHEGKYLLVKRKNEPLKGEYFVPGGRVLKGEKLEDAIKRKMKEEVGIDIKIISVAGFYEDFYKENELGLDLVHTLGVVYVASPLSTNIKLDDQSSDFIWSEKLPEKFKLNHATNY